MKIIMIFVERVEDGLFALDLVKGIDDREKSYGDHRKTEGVGAGCKNVVWVKIDKYGCESYNSICYIGKSREEYYVRAKRS